MSCAEIIFHFSSLDESEYSLNIWIRKRYMRMFKGFFMKLMIVKGIKSSNGCKKHTLTYSSNIFALLLTILQHSHWLPYLILHYILIQIIYYQKHMKTYYYFNNIISTIILLQLMKQPIVLIHLPTSLIFYSFFQTTT